MASEKLKDWVRKKLDEGVSEERIRKSLENTGHDPDLVEQVKNPFQEGEEEEDEELQEVEQHLEEEEEEEGKSGSPGAVAGFRDSVEELSFSMRYLVPVVAVLLVAGLGSYTVLGSSSGVDEGSGQVSEAECPDVGVSVNSAYPEKDGTRVNVLVTRGTAEVTVKLFQGGAVVGEETRSVGGRAVFRFDARGDEVVMRPEGCERVSDRYVIS